MVAYTREAIIVASVQSVAVLHAVAVLQQIVIDLCQCVVLL